MFHQFFSSSKNSFVQLLYSFVESDETTNSYDRINHSSTRIFCLRPSGCQIVSNQINTMASHGPKVASFKILPNISSDRLGWYSSYRRNQLYQNCIFQSLHFIKSSLKDPSKLERRESEKRPEFTAQV